MARLCAPLTFTGLTIFAETFRTNWEEKLGGHTTIKKKPVRRRQRKQRREGGRGEEREVMNREETGAKRKAHKEGTKGERHKNNTVQSTNLMQGNVTWQN
jgi:hypothetical protein